MGFFRRLFGGLKQQNVRATSFNQVRDDAVLHVVGESYRQKGVAQARPPRPDDLPPGLPPPPPGLYKAMLMREPNNQYDKNAIAAYLWSGGTWSQVGYLARGNAADYQPLFWHLSKSAEAEATVAISCDAAIIEERDGKGVVLHLGTPGECVAELATDDRSPAAGHAWVGQAVVFTGQRGTTIFGVPLDRPAQVMLAKWAGCEVFPRLTKKTAALIVADPSDATSNLLKAQEYGIPVIQEPDFLVTIGIAPDAIAHVSGRWAQG